MDPLFTEEQLNKMSREDIIYPDENHSGSIIRNRKQRSRSSK